MTVSRSSNVKASKGYMGCFADSRRDRVFESGSLNIVDMTVKVRV